MTDRVPARSDAREEAFARWVLPEVGVLYRVALTLTAQPADAEDLVQDTLVRAYRAVDRFDGRHPRAWLLTILRNTQRNRARRRIPLLFRDPDVEADRGHPRDVAPSPEDEHVDRLFDAAVEEALASLPARFRRAVELVDVDGLSYAEAAAALGVPTGTVMSRLHRARSRMRARLEDSGHVPGKGERR